MGLFRKEVLSKQQRLQGGVVLTQPLSLTFTVLMLVIVTVLLAAFLSLASYSRKETVRGYLKPDKGIVKTYGQISGFIKTLHVAEGDCVQVGQPLITVARQKQFTNHQDMDKSDSKYDLSELMAEQLTVQLALLSQEIDKLKQLRQQESASLSARMTVLEQEKSTILQQATLLDEQLQILKSRQNNTEHLLQQGFISERESQLHRQQFLDLQSERQMLHRQSLQQQRELTQVAFNQKSLPQQYQLKINAIDRQKTEVEAQLAQLRSNQEFTITATRTGVVTGLQFFEGEAFSSDAVLMYLIPENTELLAELFLPTRSAGFIEHGQLTKLRFDAFPYQRFGFIDGQIDQIEQTIIRPEEVAAPMGIREPVYRLKASLNAQEIFASGKTFSLRSGMMFEADIILERRSLMAWLFEPLISATRSL
ncbi:HlyD family efflux transporter periplasmic adaptor subunit [Thalassotalea mangrovi]|uniref:HlyD family efflux transporter periplasmic adaptor subunit n=1 Tax=Thalassotalea mangrovi TaxID=2572245 RepID=A0A4U1B5J9_9GAMM|nr:HlyD family efflux transporter periplasmic adaptor subunit [Thalassotalea mangrovi]TKB45631.1 HlyD family efflux transporter periplasmic adaptor subunit [Thalassotalea mangrovi]